MASGLEQSYRVGRRGSHHAGPSNHNTPIECGYCGKLGHYKEECRKKKHEAGQQLTNYAMNFNNGDHGRMFIMRHKAHSMSAQVSTSTSTWNNVWFVDSGTSNHMTGHEDWFQELQKARTSRICQNRRWYDLSNTTYRECPIRKRRRTNLPQERVACSYYHEEPGFGQLDCWTGNASSLQ